MDSYRIRKFHVYDIMRNLNRHGLAYVSNLPAEFDYVSHLQALGTPVRQYGGDVVRDVKPNAAISNAVVSSANMAELTPHTEFYEFAGDPPRYVALWCIVPSSGSGGETTIADGYELLKRFSESELELLKRNLHRWRSRPTLASEGVDEVAVHPVLEDRGDRPLLRFSTLDMDSDDQLGELWVERGRAFFEQARVAIKIEQGDILIWDNWRMLHARNGFKDPRRHLRRLLIR